MYSLFLNPSYEIKMDLLAPVLTAELGQASPATRRLWHRHRHKFSLHADAKYKQEAEQLYAFYVYHQGDVAFWFDGGEHGNIEDPMFFGFGDGVTKDFFLPRRNILPSSWVTYSNRVVKFDWTVVSKAEGSIHYTAAPADKAQLTAKGGSKFPCKFVYDQQSAYSTSEFFDRLFRGEGIELREA